LQSLQSNKTDSSATFTLGKTCLSILLILRVLISKLFYFNKAPPSSVIKVTNAINFDSLKTLTEDNYDDVQSDIFSIFGQQGTVINGFIVRQHQASIGGFFLLG